MWPYGTPFLFIQKQTYSNPDRCNKWRLSQKQSVTGRMSSLTATIPHTDYEEDAGVLSTLSPYRSGQYKAILKYCHAVINLIIIVFITPCNTKKMYNRNVTNIPKQRKMVLEYRKQYSRFQVII